jgi:hypothetical protein
VVVPKVGAHRDPPLVQNHPFKLRWFPLQQGQDVADVVVRGLLPGQDNRGLDFGPAL